MRKRITLIETIWDTVFNEKLDYTLKFCNKDDFDKHMSERLKKYFDKYPVTKYLITVETNEGFVKVTIQEINRDFRKEDTYEWV